MKHLKITVDGKLYDVTVEEMDDDSTESMDENKTENVSDKLKSTENINGEKINAPMPGNIISVNVSVGQNVKKGDIIAILEAMKMENEILAPRDGKIIAVQVTKGQNVEPNQVLAVME